MNESEAPPKSDFKLTWKDLVRFEELGYIRVSPDYQDGSRPLLLSCQPEPDDLWPSLR